MNPITNCNNIYKKSKVMFVQKDQQEIIESTILDSLEERDKKYDTLLEKYKCRRNLKVYTTRLDDMNIMAKNLLEYGVLRFLEYIIKESKPIYDAKQVPPEPHVNKLRSYLILKYKINMYNNMVKNNTLKQYQVTRRKNSKLKNNKKAEASFIESVELLPYVDSNNGNAQSSLNSAVDLTVPESSITEKEYETMKTVKTRYPNKTYIIIKNCYSKDTDIIYFNKTEDTMQHYKSKDDNYKDLKFYYDSKAMKCTHCCWYKTISDIISNTSAVRCIGKPHNCTPGNCKCCCKKYVTGINNHTKINKQAFLDETYDPLFVHADNPESKVLTSPDKDLDNLFLNRNDVKTQDTKENLCVEDSLCDISLDTLQTNEARTQNALTKLSTESLTPVNLIKKALNYSPPPINLKNLSSPVHPLECLTYVIIELINSKNRIHEWYKIGSDGEIEDYCRNNFVGLENILKEQICNSNNDAQYNKITVDVCCWYSRKNFINQFLKKLSFSSLKFIISSNNYSKEKCGNCQITSPTINKSNDHIDFTLPKHVLHSSDNMNKTLSLKINFVGMMQPNSKIVNSIESFSLVAKRKNQNINPKAGVKCATKVQNTPQSDILLYPAVSVSNTANLTKPGPVAHGGGGADSMEVEILVKTILEKFKGVQLFVNENGKVSARFDSSINHLNSKDIQMLTQIIAQAQNEVDAFGSKKIQNQSEKLFGLPQFIVNNSTLSNNVIHQNLSTQKDNTPTDHRQLAKTSSGNDSDSTAIINDTSIKVNNTLLHSDFLSLMKKKRQHYLRAFESYLKQDNLKPTTESVPGNKRKATQVKDSKRMKLETSSTSPKSSEIINKPKNKIVDNNVPVACVSKGHNDNGDLPGPSRMVHIPKPIAIISSPFLQNMLILKNPTSTLRSEHAQETVLSSNPEISGFSNVLSSETTSINKHDNLFKVEESTEDDIILGV